MKIYLKKISLVISLIFIGNLYTAHAPGAGDGPRRICSKPSSPLTQSRSAKPLLSNEKITKLLTDYLKVHTEKIARENELKSLTTLTESINLAEEEPVENLPPANTPNNEPNNAMEN